MGSSASKATRMRRKLIFPLSASLVFSLFFVLFFLLLVFFFKLAISCVCESFILSLQNDILTTMQMDYTCLEEKKQKVYCKYLIYFVTQENDAKTANMKS